MYAPAVCLRIPNKNKRYPRQGKQRASRRRAVPRNKALDFESEDTENFLQPHGPDLERSQRRNGIVLHSPRTIVR